MFGLFKKKVNFSKIELEKSETFINSITKPFLTDFDSWEQFDVKNSEKSKLGLISYFSSPFDSYYEQVSDTTYGCIKHFAKNSDLVTNFIFCIGVEKIYILCIFKSSKNDNKVSELDFNSRLVTRDKMCDELKDCLKKVQSFGKFNNYSNPPPYVSFINLYNSAS